MKRRAFVGTLASLLAAGCTGAGSPESTTTGTPTTATTTSGPTTSTTDTTTTTSSSATPPEVRDLGVPVEEADCPFDPDETERVVCYPEQTDEALALTPADDELSLPTAETTFTLANDTDYTFMVNFYNWGVHKRVADEWYYIAPRMIPQPLHTLPAGETHEWTFAVDNSQEPTGGPSSESGGTLAGLGGGEYVFEASGYFDSGDHEHQIGLGAHFSLDGDQIRLSKPEDVSSTRDGETVVVTRDDQTGDPTEALVVERVGEAGVPPGKPIHDHIDEQLVRPDPFANRSSLGNALAFFESDVSVVRIESTEEIDPRFDPDEHYYLRYRGEFYEARVEPLE
jgi:hypothetical protein